MVRRLILVAIYVAFALFVTSLIFSLNYLEGCTGVASWKFCMFSSDFVARALAMLLLTGIFSVARPLAFATVRNALRENVPVAPAIPLVVAGAALVSAPLAIWGPSPTDTGLLASVTLWAGGVALLALAALRFVAPFGAWFNALTRGGPVLWALMILALSMPEIGATLKPLWHADGVKDQTFSAVIGFSSLIGLTLVNDPATYVLGQGDFLVRVNQSCSGVEGLALTTVFLGGYTALFWRHIRPFRVAMILPLALMLSLGLNVVRISLLIWIGVNVSPVLAVEGFHSHAGWLMFSLLSLGLISAIHNIRWFRRMPSKPVGAIARAPLPPFLQDWNVARILPFGVFMFTALLASTFFQDPSNAYPLRFAAMLGVLWLIRSHLTALPWRANPLALFCGLGIAGLWIVTAAPPTGSSAFGTMAPTLLVIWIATRVIGTTILVPVIEELFFRSYLLERLGATRSVFGIIAAVTISTLLFAVLHDRWVAAAVAGLIFAILALRPNGHLVDAILAHVVANGTIAGWAVLSGNWAAV